MTARDQLRALYDAHVEDYGEPLMVLRVPLDLFQQYGEELIELRGVEIRPDEEYLRFKATIVRPERSC